MNRMSTDFEMMPHEDLLKELGLFSLENRRLKWGMIIVFKYLKGCHMELGLDLLGLALDDKIRSIG